jgi:CBS domain-containing protein
MRAREALRKNPVTIRADETITAAAERMDAQAVGALVVVDGERPVGVVTDRDLVVRGVARRIPPDSRVDYVMSTDPITLDADADLRDAVQLFRDHAIRRLPLLEGERMVGMLTVDDLVIDLVSDLADLARPLMGQVLFGHPEPKTPTTAA